MNLNFIRAEKIKLIADKSVNWEKVTLGAPISRVKEIGGVYKTGDDFIGILSNKDIYRGFIEVEPVKVGFTYIVLCDNADIGDLIEPGDNYKFVTSNDGCLKVVSVFNNSTVEAVGVAISKGGGGGGITYVAGDGIKIQGNRISIDGTVVVDTELTAEINRIERKIDNIDVSKETQDRKDADAVLQNNIDAEKNERTTKDTELENKITKEIKDREAEDTKLHNTIDNLKKIYVYANGLEIKQNDLILHAGKIYIANKDMTLDTWDVDEPNLLLTDSDTISCVSYEADITINKGQLVIYNNTLYLCDTTIDKTTTWGSDKDKMIAQQVEVDLTEYYNKTETNNLLDNKEDLLKAGDDINIDKAGGNVIKVSSNVEATANSIPKRDAEGQLKSKIPTVLENDTVINNEKLTAEVNKLEQSDTNLSNKIGDLNTLTTTNKDTVVNSINELNSKRIEYITQDEYNQKVIDDTLEPGITYLIEQKNIQPTQAQYNDLLNIIYPVGSIYLSIDDNFIPSTAFGGVWEKIQTGRYLQATDTGAGAEVAESLPNITGQVSTGGQYGFDAFGSFSGALKSINVKQHYRANTLQSSVGEANGLKLDASNSNPVYQDGAKVQPDSIKVIMWKRVG